MAGRKPITQCTRAEWDEIKSKARSMFPAPPGWKFVYVWADLGDDCHGDCRRNFDRRTFTIRVARFMSRLQTEEVLIHEVAHAYDWPAFGRDDAGGLLPNYKSHGPGWGVWYAGCYCTWYEEV